MCRKHHLSFHVINAETLTCRHYTSTHARTQEDMALPVQQGVIFMQHSHLHEKTSRSIAVKERSTVSSDGCQGMYPRL